MRRKCDFGASILVAKDKTQLATALEGTLGYLDPELHADVCSRTERCLWFRVSTSGTAYKKESNLF